jgi:hypothetical protein
MVANFRKSVPTLSDIIYVCDQFPDLDYSFSNGRLKVSKGRV